MAIHVANRETFARASPQSMQVTTLPAPTGGMDSRHNIAVHDPLLCVYSYNLMPAEYGMLMREGYRDWVDTSGEVRTIIPYTGEFSGGSGDRLFYTTNEGIYDGTDDGVPPVLMLTFATQGEGAGYGVYTHYTTDAEDDLLFYADEDNGLFEFDPLLDTWVQTEGLQGLDPALVTFVVSHKQRIWFCARDSTVGYYLPVGSRTGQTTPFYFGSKFKHGGELVGLFNWSVDGGEGVDDYLVAVSRAGDLIPYKGEDPETDWSNVGTYFIGQLPRGSKVGADYGGDLMLLSELGITSMSDLLRGPLQVDQTTHSVTYKIASLIRGDMRALSNVRGWSLRYVASDGLLVITVPQRLSGDYLQYVMVRTTQGWCFWRGVPALCMDTWRGAAMAGTKDGRVIRMDVPRDAVRTYAPEKEGRDIDFSILTDYGSFDSNGLFKRGELTRPSFVGSKAPTFTAEIRYDFDVSFILPPSSFPSPSGAEWDSASWDRDVWSSAMRETHVSLKGSTGIGRTMAVAIRGYALSGTILANIDVMWRTAGAL